MNKYRFVASNLPDNYAVFDRTTMTRVPGWVSRNPRDRNRALLVDDRRQELKTIETQSVAEMSAALEKYFQGDVA
jgi:hypothetical protein